MNWELEANELEGGGEEGVAKWRPTNWKVKEIKLGVGIA